MLYLGALILVTFLGWFLFRKPKPQVTRYAPQKVKQQPKPALNTNEVFCFELNEKQVVLAATKPSPLADKHTREAYMQCLDSIPALPTVWSDLLAAIERGDAARKVAQYIKSEPTLAVEVLRHANMLAAKDVNDLGQAVVLLGYNAIRCIVTQYCMATLKTKPNTVYQSAALWKHAMATSALANIVAKYIPGCDSGVAGTLGLLHDLGRIGINVTLDKKGEGKVDVQAGYLHFEQQTFGMNHVEAGGLLAKHWHLSELIQTGILHHHHPAFAEPKAIPEAIRKEVLAVYLADLLAIHFEFAGGHNFVTLPLAFYAPMMNASLETIAADPMVSKELWRVKSINF